MNSIVLFDGVCNFCSDSVNFIIARDHAAHFKFAPLQSEIAQELLNKFGVTREETDSVILIEDEKAYLYSDAAIGIARNLDGAWKYCALTSIIPRSIRDFCYKLFARNRYRLFGRKDSCMIPTPEIRARFLG